MNYLKQEVSGIFSDLPETRQRGNLSIKGRVQLYGILAAILMVAI